MTSSASSKVFTFAASDPSGISLAPAIRQSAYSQGSRTSTSNSFSPLSIRAFVSAGVICKSSICFPFSLGKQILIWLQAVTLTLARTGCSPLFLYFAWFSGPEISDGVFRRTRGCPRCNPPKGSISSAVPLRALKPASAVLPLGQTARASPRESPPAAPARFCAPALSLRAPAAPPGKRDSRSPAAAPSARRSYPRYKKAPPPSPDPPVAAKSTSPRNPEKARPSRNFVQTWLPQPPCECPPPARCSFPLPPPLHSPPRSPAAASSASSAPLAPPFAISVPGPSFPRSPAPSRSPRDRRPRRTPAPPRSAPPRARNHPPPPASAHHAAR